MRSSATTVEKYLAELTPERRATVAVVRNLVREALPPGYDPEDFIALYESSRKR